jgi:hypothetical protein
VADDIDDSRYALVLWEQCGVVISRIVVGLAGEPVSD